MSWLPEGGYSVWSQGASEYDPNEFAWGGYTPQEWYRSPDVAGGVVYNPYWGWQMADQVRDIYRGYKTAPTESQFRGFGLKQQPGEDINAWRQYFPDRDTDAGWQSRGYGWNQETGQWEKGYSGGGTSPLMTWEPLSGVSGSSNIGYSTGNQTGGGTTGGGTASGGATGGGVSGGNNMMNLDVSGYFPQYGQQVPFPYAPDLYQASNVLGNFSATGGETPAPPEWGLASDIAARMGLTGMPTSYAPAYQAAKGVVEEDTRQAINQAAEQARLRGLRWSTPLAQQAQTIAGRNMAQLGAGWTQQELGAQEAARARQLQGAGQLYGVGQGYAGLQENAAGRALQAAGMLPQTAAMYTNLPMSVAQSAYGMGQGNQNYYNQMLAAQIAEQQRMMEENNPWLQYASGVSQLPFQMAQQMYNPSFLTQLLGMGAGIAGAYAGAPRK